MTDKAAVIVDILILVDMGIRNFIRRTFRSRRGSKPSLLVRNPEWLVAIPYPAAKAVRTMTVATIFSIFLTCMLPPANMLHLALMK